MSAANREEAEGPRVNLAAVRVRIAEGNLAKARTVLETLRAQAGETPEVLLAQAQVFEAEQRPREALDSLRRALQGLTPTLQTHAQMARLATALGQAADAEAAAAATLAMEPGHLDGLRALAFVHAASGQSEARWDVLHQMALSPGLDEEPLWAVLADLAAGERWTEVVDVLDRRENELAPLRVAPMRVRSLIGLGWRRRALRYLLEAFADGFIDANEALALLVGAGALAVAAAFVSEGLSGDHRQPAARAVVAAEAARVAAENTLLSAPFAFADAFRAREILLPEREAFAQTVARARAFLEKRGAENLARGNPDTAMDFLVNAARLSPHDGALLKTLADAAREAGRTDRYLDTLSRLWETSGEPAALLAAAIAAVQAARWPVVDALIASGSRAEGLGPEGMDRLRDELRGHVCDQLEASLAEGDLEAGLALVVGVRGAMPTLAWPPDPIRRLLRATKRRLRGLKMADANLASICSLFLVIEPSDADVCRALARLRLRHKAFGTARDLLARVVEANPHVAQDWVALAMAHHELGSAAQRDFCTARAIVLTPSIDLPPPLKPFRSQMRDA